MNKAIFYDTETTGLPLFQEPSNDPRQPHIVTLSAIMVDLDTQKTLQTLDVVIKPEDWESEPEALQTHGITKEYALDVGISERLAAEMLVDMVGDNIRIGHNQSFDSRIVRIALKRYIGDEEADVWKEGKRDCTMWLAKKQLGLSKNPKLSEAYSMLLNKEMQGAHQSMADTLACRDVYFALQGESVANVA